MNKWDILILTQPSRAAFLEQLGWELFWQMQPGVGVIIGQYDESLTLGENRNRLRDRSHAEYVSFFDDDDWPAPTFVERIVPLLDGVDYVGFRSQCYCTHLNYSRYGNTYHSLKYGSRPDPWAREGQNFYRDIVHINPMRRELATRANFDGGFGEDSRWASKLRALGIVHTEHYIEDVMYHYIWRAAKNDQVDAQSPVRQALIEAIKNGGIVWPARELREWPAQPAGARR